MEPVLNPFLFDDSGRREPAETPKKSEQTSAPKRSRAAEYIAALYIALLVCSPWLVRDATVLRPPTTGVELQLSTPALHADALVHTFKPAAR